MRNADEQTAVLRRGLIKDNLDLRGFYLAGIISIRRMAVLEPAVVFRG